MAAENSDRVREIAGARGLPKSQVLERALERGLEDLWEDLVLPQYLDGELDREGAIEHVGRPASRSPSSGGAPPAHPTTSAIRSE